MQRFRWQTLFLCTFIDLGMRLTSSSSNILTKVRFSGRILYIKRDDQHTIKDTAVTGNKSRKLYQLSQTQPFPNIIASYGGAQSNSMLALAQLIRSVSPSSQFYYFTKTLPKFLRDRPNGNLAVALQQGMILVEIDNKTYDEFTHFPKVSTPFPSLVKELLPHQPHQSFLTASVAAKSHQDQSTVSYYWVPQGTQHTHSCSYSNTCSHTATRLNAPSNPSYYRFIGTPPKEQP